MLLYKENLFVTDNTDLVIMDPATGKITKRIPAENASFLNDITVDGNGILYISDSGKSSIYKREVSGEISEWMNTGELEFPNGLLAVGEELYIAAWGGESGGNILKVNFETKEIEKVSEKGIGNLDGIQQFGNSFYISDWASGKIHKIDKNGNIEEVMTSARSVGDILFLKKQNQLVLPMNLQNEVWWYQLE